ncbi:MAG: CopG family transcriptional regulator [Planctomycetota bacterium]
MRKTQIYFPEPDLVALHRAAKKLGKSVAELVREAVRRTWLKPEPTGPIALWDGKARPAIDHDSIYDER